tara:strand:+ start:699 stop:911 length:213 start_codon:yes stop_codon:yes gene_type:complete
MNTFVVSGYTEETFKMVVYADNIEEAQEIALECMSNDDYSGVCIGSRKDTHRDFGCIDATDISGHEGEAS